ncbi:hypothetical protein SRHO_G00050490 [Serrasalmus rhombeus]
MLPALPRSPPLCFTPDQELHSSTNRGVRTISHAWTGRIHFQSGVALLFSPNFLLCSADMEESPLAQQGAGPSMARMGKSCLATPLPALLRMEAHVTPRLIMPTTSREALADRWQRAQCLLPSWCPSLPPLRLYAVLRSRSKWKAAHCVKVTA